LDQWINADPHFTYIKPKAGTTAFIKLNFDMPSYDFCLKLLKEAGVLVLPGSVMEMEGFIRIGYAYEAKQLRVGLEKISEFTRDLLK